MIQVEILEQYIEELDDNSFAKLRDWFIEFEQTRMKKYDNSLSSPFWHETELQKTEADFLAGSMKSVDWQQAKKELRAQFE